MILTSLRIVIRIQCEEMFWDVAFDDMKKEIVDFKGKVLESGVELFDRFSRAWDSAVFAVESTKPSRRSSNATFIHFTDTLNLVDVYRIVEAHDQLTRAGYSYLLVYWVNETTFDATSTTIGGYRESDDASSSITANINMLEDLLPLRSFKVLNWESFEDNSLWESDRYHAKYHSIGKTACTHFNQMCIDWLTVGIHKLFESNLMWVVDQSIDHSIPTRLVAPQRCFYGNKSVYWSMNLSVAWVGDLAEVLAFLTPDSESFINAVLDSFRKAFRSILEQEKAILYQKKTEIVGEVNAVNEDRSSCAVESTISSPTHIHVVDYIHICRKCASSSTSTSVDTPNIKEYRNISSSNLSNDIDSITKNNNNKTNMNEMYTFNRQMHAFKVRMSDWLQNFNFSSTSHSMEDQVTCHDKKCDIINDHPPVLLVNNSSIDNPFRGLKKFLKIQIHQRLDKLVTKFKKLLNIVVSNVKINPKSLSGCVENKMSHTSDVDCLEFCWPEVARFSGMFLNTLYSSVMNDSFISFTEDKNGSNIGINTEQVDIMTVLKREKYLQFIDKTGLSSYAILEFGLNEGVLAKDFTPPVIGRNHTGTINENNDVRTYNGSRCHGSNTTIDQTYVSSTGEISTPRRYFENMKVKFNAYATETIRLDNRPGILFRNISTGC